MEEKKGLVMVYTGNGKGKTTAALGLALRAVGHGARVFMAQFRKSDPGYGEIQAIRRFLPGFTVLQSKRSRITRPGDFSEEDREDAQNVFAAAKEALYSGNYDMVIFDEINFAVSMGLVSLEDVLDMVNNRPPGTDVVLTGRGAREELVEIADLVSEVREIKHHFQNGVKARPGIEY